MAEDLKKKEEIKKLLFRRDNIHSRFTIFKNFLAKCKANSDLSTVNITELRSRMSRVEYLLSEFYEVQCAINYLADEPQVELEVIESFEQTFFSTIAEASDYANYVQIESSKVPRIPQALNSTGLNSTGLNVKLPVINLPTFSGEFENWLEFHDTFESLINQNPSINEIQRFHYLRASLENEAAKIISSLAISASSYKTAWDLLCERYDNKALLIYNHTKALLEIKEITRESADQLRFLIDHVSKHLRCLKTLGQPTDKWDTLLIFIFASKLDPVTIREWDSFKYTGDVPTMQEFLNFLRNKASTLGKVEARQAVQASQGKGPKGKESRNVQRALHSQNRSCPMCQGSHKIYSCSKFLKLSVNSRSEKVKVFKLCINCLNPGHQIDTCRYSACRKCGGKHNSLLHIDSNVQNDDGPESRPQVSCTTTIPVSTQVLLSTVRVNVEDRRGNIHSCTALLDSASQSNFISTDLQRSLDISKTKVDMTIIGITQVSSSIKQRCEIQIHSTNNAFSASLSCLIVDNICDRLPNYQIDISSIAIPQNIHLADPNFNIPKTIDLLIGADLFWQILCIGQIKLTPSQAILQKTRFGWIVAGPLAIDQGNRTHCHLVRNGDIQDQLARFWEIEECSVDRILSIEEQDCESHFIDTHKRDSSGRFITSIPLKDSTDKLGHSKSQAQKRFYNLERRLQSNHCLREMYTSFLEEYEAMGHMTKIHQPEPNEVQYFLPHHGVVKEESLTTKLRVVFDGSCPTSSGWSINDIQKVGPQIQSDLLSILLRFRQGKYAASSDICKMYRQVLIEPSQRSLQQILWRKDPRDSLEVYQLNTVTYGTAAASFMAVRCVQELAFQNKKGFPEASEVILRDMYVDDLLTSNDSLEQLSTIAKQVFDILAQGCFDLRKWVSNDPKVLKLLHDSISDSSVLQLGSHENTKTLGLRWCSRNDTLLFHIPEVRATSRSVTKRTILSSIAQIYDPLGLLCACTVVAKILLQKLWQEKLSWDESVPIHIHTKWSQFRDELKLLNNLRIPRHIKCFDSISIEVHAFCDASNEAYGSCVFIRSINVAGQISVSLLCAKSKVAPLKLLTTPKLELCGALTLARLLDKVLKSLTLQVDKVFCWSDSTIVLGWIRTSPSLLKTFVANRVVEIQTKTDINSWLHVNGKDNPADLLSRGTTPKGLVSSNLWWHGPDWLSEVISDWPSSEIQEDELPELKICTQTTLHVKASCDFPVSNFSSLTRLKRCVAYCIRFKNNISKQKHLRTFGHLRVKEIQDALQFLLKVVQAKHFSLELSLLEKCKPIDSKSKLLSLNPFLDKDGIIRVGGRLSLSPFTYVKQHPIIIPAKDHLTTLIFREEHEALLHAGPQHTLASIRERFWPISGRNVARNIVRLCIKCCRLKASTTHPLMGELPKERLMPSPPFAVSGVDYAGPFILKERRGRCNKTYKAWVCLFICFTTKAIHLEIATDLSQDAFLSALRRFTSRRGKPIQLFSDNGTNFTGAKNEIEILSNFLKDNQENLSSLHVKEGIDWKFIPANSPHFGGLWEAGVKSMKFHLKRVIGNAILVFEDFQTVLVQTEAILNSRPLSPLSSDPTDLTPITPSHFLIGRPLTAVPDPDLSDIKENRFDRFQRMQRFQQDIWARWSKEYVSELQQRHKWRQRSSQVTEGTLVLIKDNRLPPLSWNLGRVIDTHPGSDGIVRVVSLKTSRGILRRAVASICPLPLNCSEISEQ